MASIDTADKAFAKLKQVFSSPPILLHPDPEWPFVVEVDTSETDVGAVLSQRFGKNPNCFQLPFFL